MAIETKLGVIGWPVAHSFSPAMQNAGLQALGIDWHYGAFAVAPDALAAAIHGAAALGFVGLNVTLPHKEGALAASDPDAEAARIGAVNTLVFGDGGARPRGYNTDAHGFRRTLDELGAPPTRAAVLGAGGAARAIVHVLQEAGCAVTLVSRSDRRLVLDGSEPPHAPWEAAALAALLPTVDLLVDCTPRGISGAEPPAPVDVALLPEGAAVVDLAARPSTPLVGEARARGLRAATGTTMLLHQGVRALELWTGRPAPVDAMRDALVRAMVG